MANGYGYYLPLHPNTFQDVRFLGIAEKTELVNGNERVQKEDRNGTPVWVVSALVKFGDKQPETENFTLTASNEVANSISKIAELTRVKLVGLSGGKWSRKDSNQTAWTFQIAGLEMVKE